MMPSALSLLWNCSESTHHKLFYEGTDPARKFEQIFYVNL